MTNIMGAAASAVAAPQATAQWATKPFQCDGVERNHWLYAAFCFPCTAAHAKAKSDNSNPVFNFLCFTPLGSYNYIRLSYNIIGECGGDLFNGCLCMPCGVRQAWTEVETRGTVPGVPPPGTEPTAEWTTSLFQCSTLDCLMAMVCPCVIAKRARVLLQPAAAKNEWFDYCCLLPTSMYGTVRHTAGIASEWPHATCEDLAVGVLCYPCALNRAMREAAAYRAKAATNTVGAKIGDAKNKAVGHLKSALGGRMS
jgi:hypothetical protein